MPPHFLLDSHPARDFLFNENRKAVGDNMSVIVNNFDRAETVAKRSVQKAFARVREDIRKEYEKAARLYLEKYFYDDFKVDPKKYRRTYNFRDRSYYTTTNQSFYQRGRLVTEELKEERVVTSYVHLTFSPSRMRNYTVRKDNRQTKEDIFEWNFYRGHHGAYINKKGKTVVVNAHGRYKRAPGKNMEDGKPKKQMLEFFEEHAIWHNKDRWWKEVEQEIKNVLPQVFGEYEKVLQKTADAAYAKAQTKTRRRRKK